MFLTTNNINKLIAAFESKIYIRDTAIEDGIRGRAKSCNVIHVASVIRENIHPVNPSNNLKKIILSRRQKIYQLDSPD
ncbi:MAG: hypothetical protein WBA93_12460 [Microcoleaceae cyanobacterium]